MENMFKTVILYLISKSPGVGEVQLRKGIFLADSLYYANNGKSLTGCEYIKKAHGPVPNRHYYNMFLSIVSNENIRIQYEDKGLYIKHAYYIDNKQNIDIEKSILEILDSVVSFISNKTAKELSNLTHGNVYNNTPMDAPIHLDKIVEYCIDDESSTMIPEHIEEHIKTIETILKK